MPHVTRCEEEEEGVARVGQQRDPQAAPCVLTLTRNLLQPKHTSGAHLCIQGFCQGFVMSKIYRKMFLYTDCCCVKQWAGEITGITNSFSVTIVCLPINLVSLHKQTEKIYFLLFVECFHVAEPVIITELSQISTSYYWRHNSHLHNNTTSFSIHQKILLCHDNKNSPRQSQTIIQDVIFILMETICLIVSKHQGTFCHDLPRSCECYTSFTASFSI